MVKRYGANNYHPIPVTINRAQGVYVWDTDDKIYLDCLGGYSSVNQGHRHPEIIKAAKRQMDMVTLTTRAFDNDQMEPFLKTLCEFTEMEMALPMNTGAEAVETAIKMARKWAYTVKNIPDKHANIVVCSNNFHGRTTTIVGFSTNPQAYTNFGPYDRSFRVAKFGDIESLKMQMNSYTAAVMIEPIQGEGGILIPPKGYLAEVKALCKANNVLFILDEVQTGFGRTGKLFAWQHEGDEAKPDAIILGKALSGGVYPVSAVASSADIMGVFEPGDHGSTYGGNPLASAIAKRAMEVIDEEGMVKAAAESGTYLMDELRKLNSPKIKEIRGQGLFIGLEVEKSAGLAYDYCKRYAEEGILVKDTHEQVIRFAPPLIISQPQLNEIVEITRTIFAE